MVPPDVTQSGDPGENGRLAGRAFQQDDPNRADPSHLLERPFEGTVRPVAIPDDQVPLAGPDDSALARSYRAGPEPCERPAHLLHWDRLARLPAESPHFERWPVFSFRNVCHGRLQAC